MSGPLEFTGERFIPGAPGEIWYEHWHRYHFATALVVGRDTLDIACGAGYGSALLARHAASVVGADLSRSAIDSARATYASIPNLEYEQADCSALPFADASFDAVVSFETIEHITGQEKFLDEVRRVLRPDGLFIVSSPNKLEYTDRLGAANEYHVRELYRDELAEMLTARFPYSAWFGQRISFYSVIWPERPVLAGELFEVSEASAADSSPGHARPLYFIVAASPSAQTVAAVAPRLSVLADRDEWVYGNYAQAWSDVAAQWNRANTLDAVVAEWQGHHREAVRQRDALLEAAKEREAAFATEVHRFERELARRETLRWWIGQPKRWLARGLARNKA
jgi:SAM-dependent methyltransferase